MTLDTDPAGSTVRIQVDTTWHTASWVGAATVSSTSAGTVWKQTARTTDHFASTNHAAPTGATQLAVGPHYAVTEVAWSGGDTITHAAGIINVTA